MSSETFVLPAKNDLIASLRSDVCPACGKFKKPAMSLCRSDYGRLPKSLKDRLYQRIGVGYEQAMTDAMTVLNVTTFILIAPKSPSPLPPSP